MAPALSPPLPPAATPAQALADELIELVRSTDVGGGRGDANGLMMFAAYTHGLRRFIAIRRLAAVGAGPETLILTRSLLSMVARAVYVDQIAEGPERQERWLRSARSDRAHQISLLEGAQAIGITADEAQIEALKTELASYGPGPRLPNDVDLFRLLKMETYYHHVYVPGSDSIHFGLGQAIAELQGTEHVQMDAPQEASANHALQLAILVYATLVDMSERTVGHGLREQVTSMVTRSTAFDTSS